MGIFEDLEVDAEQRWMADVLVELYAIRKLLEKLTEDRAAQDDSSEIVELDSSQSTTLQ